MRIAAPIKNLLIAIICYLYILLFVYAAVSKLIEFEDFQTQLGQSPLLGAFAIPVSYGVPGFELLISLFLSIRKTRLIGLYLAFALMVIFAVYIIIILNFTAFTPCSCGGVLEDLGWTEHLIFNIVFVVLAAAGILLLDEKPKMNVVLSLSGLLVLGTVLVIIVFLLSEKEIKRNNAFQRKYIPHALEEIGEYQLESNSFYLAGMDDQNIYLGNYNAPLYLKVIRRDLGVSELIKIEIEDPNLPYKRIRINVKDTYFFLGDGSVPIVLRGKTGDWNTKIFSKGEAYFYDFQVIDSNRILISTTSTKSQSNVLGVLHNSAGSVNLVLEDKILKAQIDGTFDTDGELMWNAPMNQMVFVYYYRNQFEVSDEKLSKLFTGSTIDTISHAQIDVGHYKKENVYKLGKSTLVNKSASAWGNFLYINTDRLGKYENDRVLRSAGIIDVYDLSKDEYKHSFYFYHQPDEKLGEFIVKRDTIVGIVGDKLWIQKIKPDYF